MFESKTKNKTQTFTQNWEGATNVCIIDFMTQMLHESPIESLASIQIELNQKKKRKKIVIEVDVVASGT